MLWLVSYAGAGFLFGPLVEYAITIAFVALLAVGVWLNCRRSRRFNRERAAWLERNETWDDDDLAERIERSWNVLAGPPDWKELRQIFAEKGVDTRSHALVVCLGSRELPPAGDYRMEPEVLTPTEAMVSLHMGTKLLPEGYAIVFAGLLLMLPILNAVGVVPEYLRNYELPVVAGLVLTLALLYRYGLRPSYVRVAPRIIQVLRYTFGRWKPEVRNYPMTAGTIVVFTETLNSRKLTLSSGDLLDEVSVNSRRGEHFWEAFWRAILSTAPTPPLSADELLG